MPVGLENELRLQVGDTLQMEMVSGKSRQRYLVRVIGYMPGRSILVTTPLVGGKVMLVREGQAVTVRLLSANRVIGFMSSVIRSQMQPYPYLHLGYPRELESVVVRRSQRVNVRVPASVQNQAGPEPLPAAIIDISLCGALLEASRPLGSEGDKITIAASFPVANAEHKLSLSAVIRTVQEVESPDRTGPLYHYGMEFSLSDPRDSLVLHGFVYGQIVDTITGSNSTGSS